MTTQEKLDWLRLLRTEGIGQITFHKLISKYQSPSKAIEFLDSLKKYKIAPISVAEKEIENAEKLGVTILFSCDTNYPFLLSQIPDKPAVLYVLGNIDSLKYHLMCKYKS